MSIAAARRVRTVSGRAVINCFICVADAALPAVALPDVALPDAASSDAALPAAALPVVPYPAADDDVCRQNAAIAANTHTHTHAVFYVLCSSNIVRRAGCKNKR